MKQIKVSDYTDFFMFLHDIVTNYNGGVCIKLEMYGVTLENPFVDYVNRQYIDSRLEINTNNELHDRELWKHIQRCHMTARRIKVGGRIDNSMYENVKLLIDNLEEMGVIVERLRELNQE